MRLLFTLKKSPAPPWPQAPGLRRLTEVCLALSPTRVAAGIHSSCRDQRLGKQSLHCPAASTVKGKKDFNSGDRERKGGGWRRWEERS